MNIFNIKYDRVSAYLIDLLLIAVLVTLLIQNIITNPFYNNNLEAQKHFSEVYNSEVVKYNLNNKDEMISFVKAIAPAYRTQFIRKNFASSLWYVVLTILYFGFFAWFNDGQTLGKKMCRVKVVNNEDGKSASLKQLIIRNIFGGNYLLLGTNLVLVCYIVLPIVKNSFVFFIITSILAILSVLLDIVFLILFIFKKNGRTLDDLVGKTKVISIPKKKVLNNQ